jgi:hypothetical protein
MAEMTVKIGKKPGPGDNTSKSADGQKPAQSLGAEAQRFSLSYMCWNCNVVNDVPPYCEDAMFRCWNCGAYNEI